MGILVRHQQVGKRISTGSRRQRVFATAMAVLMAEFNAYLDRDGADGAQGENPWRRGWAAH
jgi:hypothetical protein